MSYINKMAGVDYLKAEPYDKSQLMTKAQMHDDAYGYNGKHTTCSEDLLTYIYNSDYTDPLTGHYILDDLFYDLPSGIDFADIPTPSKKVIYRKTVSPTLIKKYSVNTTTYPTYTLDASGLKNGTTLVANYIQIESDWALTYSDYFVEDSSGDLVRYSMSGSTYSAYQSMPSSKRNCKYYVGEGIWDEFGGSGGGSSGDYSSLSNKPKINNNALDGDRTSSQLKLLGEEDIQIMKNKTINADNNTITNLLVSSFKSTAISTTIPPTEASASDLKFTTEKSVIKAILNQMSSIFQIQGGKDTEAEILALTGSADMEAWICKENSRIYYWKNSTWNWVALTDLSTYQKKEDSGLTTTDKTIVGAINEIAEKSSTINDKSEEFKTSNETNYTIKKSKLFDFNSISNLFFDGTRKTNITDLQSSSRNILQMPLGTNYPDKITIQLTSPAGNRTSQEQKNYYYVTGGAGVIDKEKIKLKTFRVRTWVALNNGDPLPTSTKMYDSAHNEVIGAVSQNWITLAYGETKDIYVVDWSGDDKGIVDGSRRTGPEDGLGNRVFDITGKEIYATDMTIQQIHKVKKKTITIDIDYIYYCLLYSAGCEVNADAVYSDFNLKADNDFLSMPMPSKYTPGIPNGDDIVETNNGGVASCLYGFMGSYDIKPKTYSQSTSQIIGEIDATTKKLSISGSLAVEKIFLSTTF